jgi:hypothetical protein
MPSITSIRTPGHWQRGKQYATPGMKGKIIFTRIQRKYMRVNEVHTGLHTSKVSSPTPNFIQDLS